MHFLEISRKKYFQESYNCKFPSLNLSCRLKLRKKNGAKKKKQWIGPIFKIKTFVRFTGNYLIKRKQCNRPSFDLEQLTDDTGCSIGHFMIKLCRSTFTLPFPCGQSSPGTESTWVCQPGLGWGAFHPPHFFSPKASENSQNSQMCDCNKECWELPWDIKIAVTAL